MKLYLDNNVVSGIAKDDLPSPESPALLAVLEAAERGAFDLCTSEVAYHEIAKYRGPESGMVRLVYQLLVKVPFIKAVEFDWGPFDMGAWLNPPRIKKHPTWVALKALGLKDVDAHHLAVAIKSGCDIFVTCDEGILKRGAQVQQVARIPVCRPSQVQIP